MEYYVIRYNDGVYAETFSLVDDLSEDRKQKYFAKRVEEYNKNCNPLYHITTNNIKPSDWDWLTKIEKGA